MCARSLLPPNAEFILHEQGMGVKGGLRFTPTLSMKIFRHPCLPGGVSRKKTQEGL